MKQSRWVPAVALALVVGLFPVADAAAGEQGQGQAPVVQAPERGILGQYIVVVKPDADPRSVAAVAGAEPRHVYSAALNGFAAALTPGQLTALQHNRSVDYIERTPRSAASPPRPTQRGESTALTSTACRLAAPSPT
jgi:hypothetical protein